MRARTAHRGETHRHRMDPALYPGARNFPTDPTTLQDLFRLFVRRAQARKEAICSTRKPFVNSHWPTGVSCFGISR